MARRALVCTGGWPGSAVCALLDRLRGAGAAFEHHGDVDREGLAIARWLLDRYGARPDRTTRRRIEPPCPSPCTAPHLRPPRQAPAFDDPLAAALSREGVAVSEEATLNDLIADLARVDRQRLTPRPPCTELIPVRLEALHGPSHASDIDSIDAQSLITWHAEGEIHPPDLWKHERSGALSCAYDGGETVFHLVGGRCRHNGAYLARLTRRRPATGHPLVPLGA